MRNLEEITLSMRQKLDVQRIKWRVEADEGLEVLRNRVTVKFQEALGNSENLLSVRKYMESILNDPEFTDSLYTEGIG